MISGTVAFHDSLTDLLVPIGEVRPYPNNPRNGDVEAIAESIQINGFLAPVVAEKRTRYIVAGNHRYHALHQLGSEVIPVIWAEMDDIAIARYNLADNRTSDLGRYDTAQLAELLEELQERDSLLGTGYTKIDLENIKAVNDLEPDYDDVASWPTLQLTVPPHIKRAFYEVTEHAVSDHDRMESLLRMAGWRPRKESE